MKFFVFLLSFICLSDTAYSESFEPWGDEDPMPLSCVNFSGSWRSDGGMVYSIHQNACSMIEIRERQPNGCKVELKIVPDDRLYEVSGPSWSGQTRHRWDAQAYGSMVQTYTTRIYPDHKESDVVQIEIVDKNLLLESTYRTITPNGGAPKQVSFQQVFRRESKDQN